MTKLRDPGSIEEAVQQVLGVLGNDGVERVTGKTARFVRAWADPDDDARQLPVHQAIALDAAMMVEGHNPPIITAIKAELDRRTDTGEHVVVSPQERLCEIMAEVGDVAEVVRASINPGSERGAAQSPNERRRIAKQAHEAIAALAALLRDMEA